MKLELFTVLSSQRCNVVLQGTLHLNQNIKHSSVVNIRIKMTHTHYTVIHMSSMSFC